ncbi:MAG TPA: iron ABC transporter permease [Spirochaetia bacterium]|nr:iron ABC transporter permease [Spirochaetia bacterium]
MTIKVPRRVDFWTLVTLLGYAVVILFLILPLFNILGSSFIGRNTGRFDLSNYREFLSKPYYYVTMLNSLIVSVGGTIGSVLLGVPLALFTTRYLIRGKALLSTLAVLALLSPPFIGAYSWIIMLGNNGFLRNFFTSIGVGFPQIYGPFGIILVYTLQHYPFVFLLVSGALSTVDRSLEEASENLGSRGTKTFFRVTLPLVTPSLTTGALIAFMISLADFGTPMILGRNFRVLPTMAYNLFTSDVGDNPGLAATVSMFLILVSTIVLFLQRYAAARRKYSSTLVNRPVVKRLHGARNFAVHLVCYLIVGLSTLPLAIVVLYSFRKTKGPVFHPGFDLGSYQQVFHQVPRAIFNTLFFSIAALVVIVVVGTLIGFVLARRNTIPSRVLDPLLMIPYIVPGTVLGIGFVVAFNRRPIYLVGTAAIMILSYFIRRLPYSVRSSASILKQIDPSIEEAAINLGARPARSFFKVTLPLMAPGVLSGGIMSWVTAVNELSSSIVLYVGATATMTVRIYLAILDGYFGTASALATLLLLATGIALYAVNRFFGVRNESLVS